jgi:hypothetical protein
MPLSARAQCQKRPITVSKETCSFQYLGNGIPGEDALISVAGEGVIRRGIMPARSVFRKSQRPRIRTAFITACAWCTVSKET